MEVAGMLKKAVQSFLKLFGYQLVKSGPGPTTVPCPQFPQPDAQIVKRTLDNFSNTFDISTDCDLSEQQIREKIDSYFWHYPFLFNPGIEAKSDFHLFKTLRGNILKRYKHFFPSIVSLAGGSLKGKTVLDCGCNCGFWSIQAQRNGADSVLGFDGTSENIDQANFIKKLIGLDGVEYRVYDVHNVSSSELGQFDITFFLGVLYHICKPVDVLARLKDVTRDFVVVDTSLILSENAILTLRSDVVHNQNYSNVLRMYPSAKAVHELLKYVGFRKIRYIENAADDLPQNYLKGTRRVFLAEV